MRANVAEFLQPGEQIQAVFPAQTKNPYLVLIGVIGHLPWPWTVLYSKVGLKVKSTRPRDRVVVATDRRILVCEAGTWRMSAVKKVLRELPRLTQIGPASGLWYRTAALGERLYIHRSFREDVELADS
jgi:hypothetical protein